MERIKKIYVKISTISVLWIVIPIFILIIIPTLWYTKPLLNLTSSDVKIYQLAITVLGVTVGIGTVVNSTRSASIAAESVRLTREKDLREQSSHLVIVSPIGGFPIDLPHYLSKVSPNLDTARKDISNGVLFHSINNAKESILQPFMSNVGFTLVNSGKGACLNLEYEFIITNVEEFHEYSFNFDGSDVIEEFVSYTFEINELSSSYFEIDIISEWMRKGMLQLDQDSETSLNESTDSYKIKRGKVKRYHEIVTSEENIKLNIPTSFIILCRQYLLVNHLKVLIRNVYENRDIPDELEHVLNHEAIIPEAKVRLSYHDESDVRNGNYDFSKKTVELHSLRLVELNDYDVENEIPYFLEISPVK